VLAAAVATPWAAEHLVPGVLAAEIPIPIAIGVGWLLGPLAASGDRWTAGGTAVAAAILGTITGAFVVAGTSAPLWADSLAQAIGYTIAVGAAGVVFFGTWSWLIALPVTLVWAFLTRRTTRAWDGRRGTPVAFEGEPSVRRRVPSKLRRRHGRGALGTGPNPAGT
jgi:hypothetical protein